MKLLDKTELVKARALIGPLLTSNKIDLLL